MPSVVNVTGPGDESDGAPRTHRCPWANEEKSCPLLPVWLVEAGARCPLHVPVCELVGPIWVPEDSYC